MAKWRERQERIGGLAASATRLCADELEAFLASPSAARPEQKDDEKNDKGSRVDEQTVIQPERATAPTNEAIRAETARLRETVQRLNRRCQLAEAAANLNADQWDKRSKGQGRAYIYSLGRQHAFSAPADREALHRSIVGALRSFVAAHGPSLDGSGIGSAATRVTGAIRSLLDDSPVSAPSAAVAWQPIETAPKDGNDLLVLHPDGSICISYWGCIRGVYGLKSKLHVSASGGDGDFCRDATHWMPLPLPPIPSSKEKEK